MSKNITITKVGGGEPPPVAGATCGGAAKTRKAPPKGILKRAHATAHAAHATIKPVADPAKAPPHKKTVYKHTIKVLTPKGVKRNRKTLRNKVKRMSDTQVRDIVTKSGLLKNKDTPVSIMREMVVGGSIAGFISLD
jgi:hypothetical protein